MQAIFTQDDDVSVLEAVRDYARSLRRRGTPEQAPTASKLEIALSRAIEEAGAGDDSPAPAAPQQD